MTDAIQVTVAINSEEGAHKIANELVAKRLAASVWVSGPISSTYWWKGKAERAAEWVCTIKTRNELYSSIERIIKELHPYEEPGILALPIATGSQSYLRWIHQETQGTTSDVHDQIDYYEEGSKEQLLEKFTEAHERLITVATEALQRGVIRKGDIWGPREILAHMAGWEAMAVSRIPLIIAGMPPIKYATEAQHAAMDDAINATVVTMIGDQPFDAICNILRKTYQADAQIIRELDDAVVRPGTYVYERSKAAIEHCYQHIQALEQMHP